MEYNGRSLRRVWSIGLVALVLGLGGPSGCGVFGQGNYSIEKTGSYNGDKVSTRARYDKDGLLYRRRVIVARDDGSSMGAEDNRIKVIDRDGRHGFDTIFLLNLPKDSPLRRYLVGEERDVLRMFGEIYDHVINSE